MTSPQTPSSKLEEMLNSSARIEELSSASEDEAPDLVEKKEGSDEDISTDDGNGQNVHGWMAAKLRTPNIPHLFAHPSLLQDTLVSETSEKRRNVMQDVLNILTNTDSAQDIEDLNSYGIPRLQRQKHIKFLRQVLGTYPPPFQAMDASRPWLLYWALAGLSFLGVDVSVYKERTVQTITPMQNPEGGFGGGHGQLSHCAASYAATLSLAMVGGLDMVNRKTMWNWLGSVKQPDGSFSMAVNGEKDVRYVALLSSLVYVFLADSSEQRRLLCPHHPYPPRPPSLAPSYIPRTCRRPHIIHLATRPLALNLPDLRRRHRRRSHKRSPRRLRLLLSRRSLSSRRPTHLDPKILEPTTLVILAEFAPVSA